MSFLAFAGYGIATPMGSPWRDKISLAILELQEKGEIQMLYDKWWKSPSDTCTPDKAKESSKANALGVDNIGGVFVVLLCGLAFAVLIAILEFCHNSRRQHQNLMYIENMCMGDNNFAGDHHHPSRGDTSIFAQNQSLFSDMTEELCFAFRCQGSRQRPAFKRQCVKCQQQFQQNTQQYRQKLKVIQSTSPAMLPPPPPPQNAIPAHDYNYVAPEVFELQELSRATFSRSMPQNIGQCCDANDIIDVSNNRNCITNCSTADRISTFK